MVTIVVYQSLSNSAMYEHRCLENINMLYKSSGKFDDHQQYKSIIGSEMVSTPEGFTYNSPMSPIQYVIVKNPSARKSLRSFEDRLEVRPKTAVRKFCADK